VYCIADARNDYIKKEQLTMKETTIDLIWWITVVDLPALAGLLWMIWRVRGDTESSVDELRDDFHEFKLEVAKTYASQKDMRSIEKRLVEHLLRIESKLDATALKAEGLQARVTSEKG